MLPDLLLFTKTKFPHYLPADLFFDLSLEELILPHSKSSSFSSSNKINQDRNITEDTIVQCCRVNFIQCHSVRWLQYIFWSLNCFTSWATFFCKVCWLHPIYTDVPIFTSERGLMFFKSEFPLFIFLWGISVTYFQIVFHGSGEF